MSRALPWFVAAFALAFVIAPALTQPFTGYTADQLPVFDPQPPVQPAGYAFSIWGLIYGWLILSAIYGIAKRKDDPLWQGVREPLAVSLALGTLWLAIANASPLWASLVIVIMAGAAVSAFLLAPHKDRWWLRAPVSIFAGWLTAASVVSVSITASGFGLIGYTLGAYAGIAIAFVIAILVQRKKPEAMGYGLTVIWALTGIVVANHATHLSVAILAGAGVIALAGIMVSLRRALP